MAPHATPTPHPALDGLPAQQWDLAVAYFEMALWEAALAELDALETSLGPWLAAKNNLPPDMIRAVRTQTADAIVALRAAVENARNPPDPGAAAAAAMGHRGRN